MVLKRKQKKIKKRGKIKKNNFRYPNLNTILMVENFLRKNSDAPLKISEIKEKIPKKVMHQTLKIILIYLWKSGKIIYGPKGIQWTYSEPKHIKKMLRGELKI